MHEMIKVPDGTALDRLRRAVAGLVWHYRSPPMAPPHVSVVQRSGTSWGVAITVDGWYSDRQAAEAVCDYWHSALADLIAEMGWHDQDQQPS